VANNAANPNKDVFRIITPGLQDSNKRGVIRVPSTTYDRLALLSKDTGVSLCRIVDQCVTFALERLEGAEDAESAEKIHADGVESIQHKAQ
jgi:predicted DNA-binding protein